MKCLHRHTHIPWRRKCSLEEVTANICKNQFRDRVCCRQQADRPPGSVPSNHHHGDSCVRERAQCDAVAELAPERCMRRAYFCALAVSLNTKHMRFVSSIFILSAIGKLCLPREWESNFNYTTRRRCSVCLVLLVARRVEKRVYTLIES
jgi:hypothetical protein